MSDVLDRTIPDSFLEGLLEGSIPCGGVKALRIPPCGAEAVVCLDRTVRTHCHGRPVEPTDFKCQQCYEKWRDEMRAIFYFAGGIKCGACRYLARSLDDFARYVPL